MIADSFFRLTGMSRLQGLQWCDRMLFVIPCLSVGELIARGEPPHPAQFLFWTAFAAAVYSMGRNILPYECEGCVGTVHGELAKGSVAAVILGGIFGLSRWMGA